MSDPADTTPKASKVKTRLILAIKLVVTAALCAYIVTQVDWGDFWARVRNIHWGWIAVVLVLWQVCLSVSAVKWQQLLKVHGAHYGLWQLHRWYYTSFFLSQFLPSMIGGDAYRIWKTYDNPRGRVAAFLAVFVERATGLLALVFLGYLAAAAYWLTMPGDAAGYELSKWGAVIGTACLIAGAAAAAVGWTLKLHLRLAEHKWCPKPITTLIHYAGDYKHHPMRCAAVVVISFVFHGTRIGNYIVMFYALGVTAGALSVTIATAATTVLGMLPITLGGIGLVDGSFMELMYVYGVARAAGITVALLTRVTIIPLALAGAVMYFTGGTKPPTRQEAEQVMGEGVADAVTDQPEAVPPTAMAAA